MPGVHSKFAGGFVPSDQWAIKKEMDPFVPQLSAGLQPAGAAKAHGVGVGRGDEQGGWGAARAARWRLREARRALRVAGCVPGLSRGLCAQLTWASRYWCTVRAGELGRRTIWGRWRTGFLARLAWPAKLTHSGAARKQARILPYAHVGGLH